jgi:hypothetical protein
VDEAHGHEKADHVLQGFKKRLHFRLMAEICSGSGCDSMINPPAA